MLDILKRIIERPLSWVLLLIALSSGVTVAALVSFRTTGFTSFWTIGFTGFFSTLRSPYPSSGSYIVIQNEEQLVAICIDPPLIDLNYHTIIAAFWGWKGTGGYVVE